MTLEDRAQKRDELGMLGYVGDNGDAYALTASDLRESR